MIGVFGVLLVLNAYCMLTIGKNPGFYEKKVTKELKVNFMACNDSLLYNNPTIN